MLVVGYGLWLGFVLGVFVWVGVGVGFCLLGLRYVLWFCFWGLLGFDIPGLGYGLWLVFFGVGVLVGVCCVGFVMGWDFCWVLDVLVSFWVGVGIWGMDCGRCLCAVGVGT